jgi:hypothetical protein
MKTKVDIDNELLTASKKRAAEVGHPLRALIEDGLRAKLRRPRRSFPMQIDWVVVDGGLPADLPELADRAAMTEWIRAQRNAPK